MVYLAPLNPDSYRDNEQRVDNFADHLREKAAIEQKNIVDITAEEMHRFKDVMFGVNTQHSGAQLRLRDDHGKVISKLKEGAQLKIVGNHHATVDDDGAPGHPDKHIWVEVEVDAAQTEAGGTGPIRGWVSTEYINALREPDPVLDSPESWGEDVPKPPKPNPPVQNENPAENAPVPGNKVPENGNPAENAPVPQEKPRDDENPAENAPVPGNKPVENGNSAGNAPVPGNKVPENGNPAENAPVPDKKGEKNTDTNTPGDIPAPKKKVDTPEAQVAPKEGLWSKFVSINKSILRKMMSPWKEEIAIVNNIANENEAKKS